MCAPCCCGLVCAWAWQADWVHRLGMNYFTIPASPRNTTDAFVRGLRAHNISHRAGFYAFDEYNGPFGKVADAFGPLRASYPEVRARRSAARSNRCS